VLLRVGVSVPMVRVMNGVQDEGPQVMLSLAYDVR